MTASRRTPRVGFATTAGALAGLAWAGALRDWMAQLAGEAAVTTWQTPAFLLAPGVVIGGVLGLAAALRGASRPVPRALIAAPLIFGVALLYPPNMVRVLQTGEGAGAIGVALVAIAGGYAIAGRGHPAVRVVCGVLAAASVVAMILLPAGVNPVLSLGSPRGTWVALQGAALVTTFAIAATASYGERSERSPRIASAST